jgi:hypothetical protein
VIIEPISKVESRSDASACASTQLMIAEPASPSNGRVTELVGTDPLLFIVAVLRTRILEAVRNDHLPPTNHKVCIQCVRLPIESEKRNLVHCKPAIEAIVALA